MQYGETERREVMSDKKYRVYTEEFNLEALALLKSSGKSCASTKKPAVMQTLMAGRAGVGYRLTMEWSSSFQCPSRKYLFHSGINQISL